MTDYVTLDELSPAKRRLVALVLVARGLGLAALVALRPEFARVPLLVLWFLCAALVLSGLAVAVYSTTTPGRYQWAIAGALASMAVVPAWIAFGPGARSCTSSFAILTSELPCRVAFGVGAILLVLMFIVALRQALAAKNAA